MSLPHLSWQPVVVGDPLLAPFAPTATPALALPPDVLLFLQRRAVFLEGLIARTPSPEVQRALALAYAEQAEELRRLQRLDQALALAQRAVAVKGDESAALYILGVVHATRHEDDQATEAFKALLSHDSKSSYARDAERWLRR